MAKDQFVGTVIVGGAELNILGDVDDHRAGATAGGDVEGLVQDGGQVSRALHQIVMLGAGAGNADRIALLEGVRPDQVGWDLPGNDHQRNRIHQGIDNAGHRIGRAGARGDQHHAGLARRARIALSRMGCALFMTDQNMLQARLVEQRVIDRQDRAARIAEQGVYALIDKGADDHFCAGHGAGWRCSGSIGWGQGCGFGHGITRKRRRRNLQGFGQRKRPSRGPLYTRPTTA